MRPGEPDFQRGCSLDGFRFAQPILRLSRHQVGVAREQPLAGGRLAQDREGVAGALHRLAAVGTIDLAATALLALANTKGDLSVVSVLGGMYPVVTVMLAAVVLLLFGSKKLPELAKGMGQAAKEFRSGMHDEDPERAAPAATSAEPPVSEAPGSKA